MSRVHVVTFLSMLALACTDSSGNVLETTFVGDESEGTPTSGDGDGDGDPSSTDELTDTDEPTDTNAPTDTDEPSDTDEPTDTDDPPDPTDGCSEGGNIPGGEPSSDDYDKFDDDEDQPHGGGGFVPPPDDYDECDIFAQDCPPNEKCVPYASSGGSWDANKCVPVMGSGMVGQSCTYGGTVAATDNCDKNSACWNINNQGVGTCTAFCKGTPQAPICPPGTACIQGNMGSIAFCVDGCNPLTQNCPAGEGCFWGGDSFSCIATTSDIPLGQPCGYINDCAKGLMCVTGSALPTCNGVNCCAQFCDLDCGGGFCAQPGTSCVPFFEAGQAPPGHADVGLCLD